MRNRQQRHLLFGESGSVVAETLLCLPIVLLAAMAVAQYALFQMCNQMVVYASFAAARATVPMSSNKAANEPVSEEWKAALATARRICSTISFTSGSGNNLTRAWLPAGSVKGSGGLSETPHLDGAGCWRSGKVAVWISDPTPNTSAQWYRAATVVMDIPIVIPFANEAFIGLAGRKTTIHGGKQLDYFIPKSSDASSPYFGYPHLRFHHTTYISKNFVVMSSNNLPAGHSTW
jgi:hypothetical protein